MASNSAGKESLGKTILLEYNGIQRVHCIENKDNPADKVSLFERVFKTSLQKSSNSVSLQRYDPEWEDHVDIEIGQIRDRDKIKVMIIDNSQAYSTKRASTTGRDGHDKGVNQLISKLQDERSALDYKVSIAQATLQSLKEAPRPRSVAGRNPHLTCSNCHVKGHRVNNCTQPPCRGYFECGLLSLHCEHRNQLKQAEAEIKGVQKQLKINMDDMENFKLLKERTRTNFFAEMRKKLQFCNPIKYSSRTTLDNDLRILATVCNHRIPSDTADLEEIIENYQNKAKSMVSVQSDISELGMCNEYHVYQKQNMSYCTSPITIHNELAPFTMPRAPPRYGPQSPLSYMYHRTPPGPRNLPPYMYVQHTTPSPGLQSPLWQSPTGNVNYRWQCSSSTVHRNIPVRKRSPNYSSSFSRGYHQKSQPTGRGNHPTSNQSYRSRNIENRKYQHGHDHMSRKRLHYDPITSSKDCGKKFRESLGVVTETKTAATVVCDDDETQDFPAAESPVSKSSNAGAASGSITTCMPENNEESQSFNEESQSFNFDAWMKEQKAVSKKITSTDQSTP